MSGPDKLYLTNFYKPDDPTRLGLGTVSDVPHGDMHPEYTRTATIPDPHAIARAALEAAAEIAYRSAMRTCNMNAAWRQGGIDAAEAIRALMETDALAEIVKGVKG